MESAHGCITNLNSGIKPHAGTLLHIPQLPSVYTPDSHLNLEFRLAAATNWAEESHLVATGQIQLQPAKNLEYLHKLGAVSSPITAHLVKPMVLSIQGKRITWEFDFTIGAIKSWTLGNANILTEPLTFDIYRARTDNDRGCDFGRNWINRRVHQAKYHVVGSSWAQKGDVIEVTSKGRIAPPVMNWALEVNATYRFTADFVTIQVHGKPTGHLLPRAWGRFGLVTAIKGCGGAKWYGRGPGESYRDKKMSQLVGTWELAIDDLMIDYEFPQDSGNRTDVRWVEFLGKSTSRTIGPERLIRARYGDLSEASFSALPYSAKDLEESQHPYELHDRKRPDTVVRLDWVHHGLGTGSCGPETLPKYTLDASKEYEFLIILD